MAESAVSLEYRSPKFNSMGSIDCEINHSKYGWVPFTASPEDPEEHGRLLYDAILAAGNIEPYQPA